jgi:hypothetical protein
VLRPRVLYERYGVPDIDVYTRRFEGRYIWSGPQGTRDHVLRIETSLRGLRRVVEHVAEGQEKSRELLKGVLEEVMRSQIISQSLN